MDPDLGYAVFDWKHTEPILEFMEQVTEKEPLCFRILDTDDEKYFNEDDAEFGSDVYIVVYGSKPISRDEAHVFYRSVLDYKASTASKKHRTSA